MPMFSFTHGCYLPGTLSGPEDNSEEKDGLCQQGTCSNILNLTVQQTISQTTMDCSDECCERKSTRQRNLT
jgi:hypothetical protein